MDLRSYLTIARRWTPLAIVFAVAAGVLAFALLSNQPRTYEASATLKLGQALTGAPILLTTVSDRMLTEYAYRGSSLATMQQVTKSLGLEGSPEELRERVATSVQPGSTLLTITARADAPGSAQDIANAVGDALISVSETSQSTNAIQEALRQDIQDVRAEIAATRTELAELRARTNPSAANLNRMDVLENRLVDLLATHGDALDRLVSTGAHSLGFVSRATPPTAPVGPGPLLYTVLAVFAGLLAAGAIAAVVEYFDATLRDLEDLEEATGLPTLGSVVEFTADASRGGDNRLITATNPKNRSRPRSIAGSAPMWRSRRTPIACVPCW